MPKISELPQANIISGTEWIPLEQDGIVRKVAASSFGAGGGGGTGSGDSFTFTQSTPSSTWSVNHALGRYPSVTIIDSTGRLVEGDVEYVSLNSLIVTFAGAFGGTAVCN